METVYERIGEMEGVRNLVDRFYDLMDTLPEAADIRQMHPEDLTESRDKLFEFLVGWTGGPPLYVAKRGHPRLRARHLPFEIGYEARDQWMLCMIKALEDTVEDTVLRSRLEEALTRIADHMRNRP